MEPFIFFSYGLTKSGSTLAFQLARAALERAGHAQPVPVLPGLVVSPKINAIEHLSEDQAEALWARVRALGHPVVLKTHTRPDPAVERLVVSGRARVHAVIRDPRDVALSMLDHGRRARATGRPAFSEIATLKDAVAGIENQLDTLSSWLSLPGIEILRYDELAFDTPRAAARILRQLGLSDDPEALADEVLNSCFTQLNKGVRDRHLTEMDAATAAAFAARFAPYIRLVEGSDAPSLPLRPGHRLAETVDKPRPTP